MSQEKVDQYKESKKNRKEEVAKKKKMAKLRRLIAWAVIALIVVGLAVGITITVVNQQKANAESQAELYNEGAMLLEDYADIQGTATEAETETEAPAEEAETETAEEAE